MQHTPDILFSDAGEPARINALLDGAGFWYWRGASGRRHIFNVYEIRHCPPVPHAVYVALKPLDASAGDGRLVVMACGVLPRAGVEGGPRRALAALEAAGASHIHVHLLARSPAHAGRIARDLAANLHLKADLPGAHRGAAEDANATDRPSQQGFREPAAAALCL